MKKLTNDEKYTIYKKRKILNYGIMGTSIITIFLAVLCLSIHLNVLFPLVSFLITVIMKQRMLQLDELEKESKKVKKTKKTKKK